MAGPTLTLKRCRTCGESKPVVGFGRHPRARDGLCGECRVCVNERKRRWHRANAERERARTRRWREENPDAYRASVRRQNIKRKFGLTVEEYDVLIARPCAICGEGPDGARMHLDHDHDTGRVRVALCEPCNLALGLFRDSPERLRAAATYIDSWEG